MQPIDELLRRFGVNPAAAPPDELEEFLYAAAARELHEGQGRPGLMARAFADAAGDEPKSKAFYLKMRVAQLRTQYEAAAQARHESELERERTARYVAPQPKVNLNDPAYQASLEAATKGSLKLGLIMAAFFAFLILIVLVAM